MTKALSRNLTRHRDRFDWRKEPDGDWHGFEKETGTDIGRVKMRRNLAYWGKPSHQKTWERWRGPFDTLEFSMCVVENVWLARRDTGRYQHQATQKEKQ